MTRTPLEGNHDQYAIVPGNRDSDCLQHGVHLAADRIFLDAHEYASRCSERALQCHQPAFRRHARSVARGIKTCRGSARRAPETPGRKIINERNSKMIAFAAVLLSLGLLVSKRAQALAGNILLTLVWVTGSLLWLAGWVVLIGIGIFLALGALGLAWFGIHQFGLF